MNENIKDYTDEQDSEFAITAYLASITGTLEAHVDGMVKYQDLGPKYFAEELKKVVDSLTEVRAKLVSKHAWTVKY